MSREQRRIYQKQYRSKLRQHYVDLLGGICANCDSSDSLEFDHIDPSTKKFTIAGFSRARSDIDKEIEKCQLLCSDCHKKKSIDEASGRRTPCGTLTSYVVYKCHCKICKKRYNEWYSTYRNRRSELRKARAGGHC